jgi:hypothetical protein
VPVEGDEIKALIFRIVKKSPISRYIFNVYFIERRANTERRLGVLSERHLNSLQIYTG